jgi:hypothetical protein
VLDAGTLPALGPGALLGGSLGWEQLDLRLLGMYLFPRAGSSLESGAGSPGAELALLAGGLLGCAPRLVQTRRLELGACAGAEVGWLWGSGTGVSAVVAAMVQTKSLWDTFVRLATLPHRAPHSRIQIPISADAAGPGLRR